MPAVHASVDDYIEWNDLVLVPQRNKRTPMSTDRLVDRVLHVLRTYHGSSPYLEGYEMEGKVNEIGLSEKKRGRKTV